jgi:predicted membrane-bound mannosyltransferase
MTLKALSTRAIDAGSLYVTQAQRSIPRPHRPGVIGWAFIAVVIVALITRMWDLGGRTLHYDEILHAYYSFRFAEGAGYGHTPLTHGPFLFHGAAATLAIFGSSDVWIRMLPAVFGVVLVALPYLLRRQMGVPGALATSVFLTVSPSILYFSRFIRNDIYMAVWALSLFIIMWHYIERPRTGLLVAWTAIWALAYTTKESTFLLAGSFGLFLIILTLPDIWRWVKGSMRLSAIRPTGDLLVVLGTLSLPMWTPFVGMIQNLVGITLVNADPNDPGIATGEVIRAGVETGAPAGGALFIAFFFFVTLMGISITLGLLWDKRRWPWLALLFIGITLTLFTSVFTNANGFFTGYWGSLGYWIAQQTVERANQPIYYYFIGLSTYEFLLIGPTLIGGLILAVRGNTFDRSIVAWSALTLLLFTLAGERMPWLLVGIALPMTLVSGRSVGLMIDQVKGARFAPAGFLGGLGLMIAVPFLVLQILRADDITSSTAFWLAIVLAVIVVAGTLVLALQLRMNPAVAAAAGALGVLTPERRSPILAAVALGAVATLLVFTVFVGWRATYSYANLERPQELLVYSQTGQETTYAAECINRIADETGLGQLDLKLLIGESDNFAWQWRWYARNYHNVEYRFMNDNPPTEPFTADVVMFSRSVESKLTDALVGYTKAGDMAHLWWFPNTAYSKITLDSLLTDIRRAESWEIATDYFLDRKYGGNMYQAHGVIYLADRHAAYAEGCTDLRATASEADATG